MKYGRLARPYDGYVLFDLRLYRSGYFYFQVWDFYVRRNYA